LIKERGQIESEYKIKKRAFICDKTKSQNSDESQNPKQLYFCKFKKSKKPMRILNQWNKT
jgi:hypothetical protein